MEQTKKNIIPSEKPKILYTLNSMNKDPSLTILNEYRARGSESLRPNRRMTEPKKKNLFQNDNSDKKNKMAPNLSDKKDKFEVIQDKKRLKFQMPAKSLSPYKPSRHLPKQLEKIEESAHTNNNIHTPKNNNIPKTELLLKGTRSKFTKANTLETKVAIIAKEKTKENASDTYKVF